MGPSPQRPGRRRARVGPAPQRPGQGGVALRGPGPIARLSLGVLRVPRWHDRAEPRPAGRSDARPSARPGHQSALLDPAGPGGPGHAPPDRRGVMRLYTRLLVAVGLVLGALLLSPVSASAHPL